MRLSPSSSSSSSSKISSSPTTTVSNNNNNHFVHPSVAARLFVVGSTVGPIVDSIHNQCLLRYHVLPITISSSSLSSSIPTTTVATTSSSIVNDVHPYLFMSSWTVPPLLGFAYIILGAVLPKIIRTVVVSDRRHGIGGDNNGGVKRLKKDNSKVEDINGNNRIFTTTSDDSQSIGNDTNETQDMLRSKAIWAVTTTALIIKLSEVLEVHPLSSFTSSLLPLWITTMVDSLDFETSSSSSATDMIIATSTSVASSTSSSSNNLTSFVILMVSSLLQWFWLDRTIVSLLAASITSIGGPLSELPFVGHSIWTYLDTASDYYPLEGLPSQLLNRWIPPSILQTIFGTTKSYEELALSSLTGPCYFAVCMDAIALGRWFESMKDTVGVEDPYETSNDFKSSTSSSDSLLQKIKRIRS